MILKKMKSAAEWIKEYQNDRFSNPRNPKLIFHTGALIKEIQKDALLYAAEIAHKAGAHSEVSIKQAIEKLN